MATDTVFHSGDRIRFSVEGNAAGYLDIINEWSSGSWKPMFPSAEMDDGNNHIDCVLPHTIPPISRLAFDTLAGPKYLFIVLANQPEAGLAQ